MNNWIDYWSEETQFVCEHHKNLSYEAIYKDLKPYISSSDRILDFGCGEGLFSSQLSQHCRKLFLYDAAQPLLDKLRVNIGNSNIRVVNDYRDITLLNLVLISSVSQYIPENEFFKILKNLRSSMSPNGRIIISDIVPLKNSIFIEILDLVKISIKNGFLVQALFKMFISLLGNYSKMRRLLPLTKYNLDIFTKNIEQLGFGFEIESHNLGLNSNRFTIVLTRRD